MFQPLSRSMRAGYGSGSVATGAFGTVPGLMLLPSPSGWPRVNAMLDVAFPALRESLLIAFLDRLERPVRGG